MDIAKYTEASGLFLKAEVVSKNPNVLFIIAGEGKMETSKKFGNERLHLPVRIGDEDFVFDCSKTNARTIEKALGTDTKKWIGNALVLEVYKTKTSDGKMTDAINVKEVKKL